jgi:hypothetical protein
LGITTLEIRSLISQIKNTVGIWSSRLDQIDRILGLEDKVDVLEYADEDREKSKEVWLEHARSLGHH